MEPINISNVKDIFFSVRGGWTITTILGNIFSAIEEKYGSRDLSYTILGVEIFDGSQPDYWYPGDCKHITIRITKKCINNIYCAVYEVAHEAIHLLSPVEFGNSTYLEEGIATYFSKQYLFHNTGFNMPIAGEKYQIAYNLTSKLLEIDESIIKELRKVQPSISAITKEMLLHFNQSIPTDLDDKLPTNFQFDM